MGRFRESWRLIKKNKQVFCARRVWLAGAATALALSVATPESDAACTTLGSPLNSLASNEVVSCTGVTNDYISTANYTYDSQITLNAGATLNATGIGPSFAIRTVLGSGHSIYLAPGSSINHYSVNGSFGILGDRSSGNTITLNGAQIVLTGSTNTNFGAITQFTGSNLPGFEHIQSSQVTLTDSYLYAGANSPQVSFYSGQGYVGGPSASDGNTVDLYGSTYLKGWYGTRFRADDSLVSNNAVTLNGTSYINSTVLGAFFSAYTTNSYNSITLNDSAAISSSAGTGIQFSSNTSTTTNNYVVLNGSASVYGATGGVRFDSATGTSYNAVYLQGASPTMINTYGIGVDFYSSGGNVDNNTVELNGNATPADADYILADLQGVRFYAADGSVYSNEVTIGANGQPNAYIKSSVNRAIEFTSGTSTVELNTVTLNGGSILSENDAIQIVGYSGANSNTLDLSGTVWGYSYYGIFINAGTSGTANYNDISLAGSLRGAYDSLYIRGVSDAYANVVSSSGSITSDFGYGIRIVSDGTANNNIVTLTDSASVTGALGGIRIAGATGAYDNAVYLQGASPVMINTPGIGVDFYAASGNVSGNTVELNGNAVPADADFITAGQQGVRFFTADGDVSGNAVTIGANALPYASITSTGNYAIDFYAGTTGSSTFNTVTLNGGSLTGQEGAVRVYAREDSSNNVIDLSGSVQATNGYGVQIVAGSSGTGGADDNKVYLRSGSLLSQFSTVNIYGYDGVANNLIDLTGTVQSYNSYGAALYADQGAVSGNTVTLNGSWITEFEVAKFRGYFGANTNTVTFDGTVQSYNGYGVFFYGGNDTNATANGNKVYLNSGSLTTSDNNVYISGYAGANSNTIDLTGTVVSYNVSGASLYSSTGTVSANTVALNGSWTTDFSIAHLRADKGANTNTFTFDGTVQSYNGSGVYIYGGTYAGATVSGNKLYLNSGSLTTRFDTATFNGQYGVNSNSVGLTGTAVSYQGYGAWFYSGLGTTSGNTVTLNGSWTTDDSIAYLSANQGANNNTVTFDGTVQSYNGYGLYIYGGTDTGATVSGNNLYLDSGSLTTRFNTAVFNGYYGANSNTVDLTGTVTAYQGYGAWFYSGLGTTSGNTVTLNGSWTTERDVVRFLAYAGANTNTVTFNSTVKTYNGYGVYIQSGTYAGNTANGNKIYLNSGSLTTSETNVRIYGEYGANNNVIDFTGTVLSYNGYGAFIQSDAGTASSNTIALDGSWTAPLGIALIFGNQGADNNTLTFNGAVQATSGGGVYIYGGNGATGNASGNRVYLTGAPLTVRNRIVSITGTYDANNSVIDLSGDTQSTIDRGIQIAGYQGTANGNTVTLNSGGSLTSQSHSIFLYGGTDASNNDVIIDGDVRSYTSYGVLMRSGFGATTGNNTVELNAGASITAFRDGVYLYSRNAVDDNVVTIDGYIRSYFGYGVRIRPRFSGIGSGNKVYVGGTGRIVAYLDGVGVDDDGPHGMYVAAGAYISNTLGYALFGGNGATTAINAGTLISASGTSVYLNPGDDFLTLRTGSSLTGIADGGPDFDTLTLEGTGSEDDDFVNFEALVMNGVEWTLTNSVDLGGSGATDIQMGKLIIDNVLTSPTVTIQPAGTLGGSGTVVGNVDNSGMIMPPDGGVFTIDGDVTFNSGSSLAIIIGGGTTNRLDVTGSATIDSGSSVALSGDFSADLVSTILTSSGLTGLFGSVTDDQGNPLPDATVTAVAGTDVQLGFVAIATASVGDVANQAAGNTTEDAFRGWMTTILNRIDDKLLNEDEEEIDTDAEFAARGLNASVAALTGRTDDARFGYDSAVPVDDHLSPLTRMLFDVDNSSADYAAQAASFLPGFGLAGDRGGAWVKGFANYSKQENDAPILGYKSVTGGLSAGLDATYDNWLIGGVIGYGLSNADIDRDAGEVDLNTVFAGLYSSVNWNEFIFNLIVTGGYNRFDSERTVTDGVDFAKASDEFDGYLWDVRAELARRFALFNTATSLRPRLAVEYLESHQNDYRDDGGGLVAGLFIEEHTTELLRLEGQLELAFRDLNVGRRNNALDTSIYVGAAYEDYNDDRVAQASIIGFGDSFALALGEEDRTLGLIGALLDYDLADGISAHLGYSGELEADFQRHNLTAGIRWTW